MSCTPWTRYVRAGVALEIQQEGGVEPGVGVVTYRVLTGFASWDTILHELTVTPFRN
jgi:hypothetical protein